MKIKIPELPKNSDEYWDGAETSLNTPKVIGLCATHFKKWIDHEGYVDNHDGTVSCKFCPWGSILPGYLKVKDEKIIDLRL